jgi:ATP-dependent DNA helicase RecQ
MRLLGYSFSAMERGKGSLMDLDSLIPAAVRLLQGQQTPPGLEADEVRDRLLAGFQHILVDEYQDIDEPQYQLIGALAGRTLGDDDLKLSLLAVGDDDQNIYSFRGANVRFIRQFQQDYQAEVHYLVENYRATRYLIEAANQWISLNTDRMKTDRPIGIDQHRALQPPGGQFGQRNPKTGGRVLIIQVPDAASQAYAIVTQLQQLRDQGVTPWSGIAVLSRTHRELARVRGLAERADIPVRCWADRDRMPPLHWIREIHRYLGLLDDHRGALVRATILIQWATELGQDSARNLWTELLGQVLEAWRIESDDAELPLKEARGFLYETLAESRREFSYGEGVVLSTVHAAKGTEHDHVLLIGEWPRVGTPRELEETRRLFYVGMTRARQTLAVFERSDLGPTLTMDLDGPAVLRREMDISVPFEPPPIRHYTVLGLDDLHLSFAGYYPKTHPLHTALANLRTGDRLQMGREGGGLGLFDPQGLCVSRLSQKAESHWSDRLSTVREVRILALVHRTADQDDDASRRERCQATAWEVPIVEVTFEGTEVNGDTS